MDNNMKLQDYGFFFGGRTEVVAVAAPGEEEDGVGARELGRAMELLEGPEGVIERNVKNTRIHTREPCFRFLVKKHNRKSSWYGGNFHGLFGRAFKFSNVEQRYAQKPSTN